MQTSASSGTLSHRVKSVWVLPEEVVADSDNEIDDEDMQLREDAAAAAPMEIGDDDDEVAALFGAL